jgi:glutamate racemase
MALGVFDSGIGGLTIYGKLVERFKDTDLIYLGDTARVPYGGRSPDTIVKYAIECASLLVDKYKADSLVVACNTISSYAMNTLKAQFNLPVIGVIEAGAAKAVQLTKNGVIGVIGTTATIKSKAYLSSIQAQLSNATVYQKACPLFVPLVEEGLIDGDIISLIARHYLDNLVANGIDTLILGCTHYPVIKSVISRLYPNIAIADSAEILCDYIEKLGLAKPEKGARELLVTDMSDATISLKTVLVGDLLMKKVKLL